MKSRERGSVCRNRHIHPALRSRRERTPPRRGPHIKPRLDEHDQRVKKRLTRMPWRLRPTELQLVRQARAPRLEVLQDRLQCIVARHSEAGRAAVRCSIWSVRRLRLPRMRNSQAARAVKVPRNAFVRSRFRDFAICKMSVGTESPATRHVDYRIQSRSACFAHI